MLLRSGSTFGIVPREMHSGPWHNCGAQRFLLCLHSSFHAHLNGPRTSALRHPAFRWRLGYFASFPFATLPSVRGSPLGLQWLRSPLLPGPSLADQDWSHPHSAGPGSACNAKRVHIREVSKLREHSDVWLRAWKAFGFRRLRPLRGRNCSNPRKACASPVRRTSRVARCPFLATSVWTATVQVRTSQKSQSPSAKVTSQRSRPEYNT